MSRLKWLPIVDELLQVWDLWDEAGQPARQSFPNIAKKLDIPESTVKSRWYKAYELIYDEPYSNNPAKRKNDQIERALQELCLKCTDPICGNKHGAEEIGCPAFERIAGKSLPREKTYEQFDMIADKHPINHMNHILTRKNNTTLHAFTKLLFYFHEITIPLI